MVHQLGRCASSLAGRYVKHSDIGWDDLWRPRTCALSPHMCLRTCALPLRVQDSRLLYYREFRAHANTWRLLHFILRCRIRKCLGIDITASVSLTFIFIKGQNSYQKS